MKSWLIWKDPDAERDWGQEEKGMTEDEMAGWHHHLDGHKFDWTPGVGDGQGGLECCDSWDRNESDTTERLNWTDFWQEDCDCCFPWSIFFSSLSMFNFISFSLIFINLTITCLDVIFFPTWVTQVDWAPWLKKEYSLAICLWKKKKQLLNFFHGARCLLTKSSVWWDMKIGNRK